jgi:hypothetical protein
MIATNVMTSNSRLLIGMLVTANQAINFCSYKEVDKLLLGCVGGYKGLRQMPVQNWCSRYIQKWRRIIVIYQLELIRGTIESTKTRELVVGNYIMAKLPLDLPNEPSIPARFLKRIYDPFIPKGHNENILAWPINQNFKPYALSNRRIYSTSIS